VASANRRGHGQGKTRAKNALIIGAHRIMCWAMNGTPPPLMDLACHICHNKSCLNPLHLRWGNHQMNSPNHAWVM
jgi:hypothetical protein